MTVLGREIERGLRGVCSDCVFVEIPHIFQVLSSDSGTIKWSINNATQPTEAALLLPCSATVPIILTQFDWIRVHVTSCLIDRNRFSPLAFSLSFPLSNCLHLTDYDLRSFLLFSFDTFKRTM